MKQIITLFFICTALSLSAQQSPDEIVGNWINVSKENLVIQVYKQDGAYDGKIVWSKDDDKKKPVGFVILNDMKYEPGSKTWENGKILDPNSGRSYNASARIREDGMLEVQAYMGLKILGTTKTFKRK